jgi:hypothetical protein
VNSRILRYLQRDIFNGRYIVLESGVYQWTKKRILNIFEK